MLHKQARFWTWGNGAPVRIKINAGQSLHWASYRQTDEGWSSEGLTLSFDGAIVHRDWMTEGKDCDGRSGSYGSDSCAYENLSARDIGDECKYPEWIDSESSQYDQYAELANY